MTSMMAVTILEIISVGILLASPAESTVSMDYCSISCRDDGSGEAVDASRRISGPPGKRGPEGPVGAPGPVGPRGAVGRPGDACNCERFDVEIQKLKILVSNIQGIAMDEWKIVSNQRWYKLFEEKITYDQAKSRCQSFGAQLASAGLRNSTIHREIISELSIGSDYVWIGLNDKAREGVWMWEDGVPAVSINWPSGQPDDSEGQEDCVHFYSQYLYNDNRCSATMYFLCETENM